LEQPHELRELASWYRSWAEVGCDEDRAWRIGFADFLEKRAGEIDAVLALAERRIEHHWLIPFQTTPGPLP